MQLRLFNKSGSVKKHAFVIIGCLLFSSVCLCCFLLRCGQQNEASDTFFSYLQRADLFYEDGKTKEAVKLLDTAKKYANSSTNWLSIIKRFHRWHIPEAAALASQEAAALFPGNENISFITSFMVLQNHDKETALRYARPLVSGGGAALNAFLQITQVKPQLLDPAILAAAATYVSSPALSENAAILYAMRQNFTKAIQLAPSFYQHYDEIRTVLSSNDAETAWGLYRKFLQYRPEFWLTVMYDSGDSEQTYQLASLIIEVDQLADIIPKQEILSLQADAAFVSGDGDNAFTAWQQLSNFYPLYKPEIWYNLARLSHSNYEQFTFIDTLLSLFPGYVPALRIAALDALAGEQREPSDQIERALSNAGMKTIDMIQKESLNHINKALAKKYFAAAFDYLKKNDTQIPDALSLEYNRFEWGYEPPDVAVIAIWRLLEQYPDSRLVNEYAVWLFCSNNKNAEAQLVLDNWLAEHEMLPWCSPWLGILAATDGNLDDAETYFRTTASSVRVDWQLFANIASVEEARKNWSSAVDLFTLAAAHTDSVAEQSNLHYRIGKSLIRQRNYKGAKTALQYALDLNSGNYSAKLLLFSLE